MMRIHWKLFQRDSGASARRTLWTCPANAPVFVLPSRARRARGRLFRDHDGARGTELQRNVQVALGDVAVGNRNRELCGRARHSVDDEILKFGDPVVDERSRAAQRHVGRAT